MGHSSRHVGRREGFAPFGSIAECAERAAGLGDALLARVPAADVRELLRVLPPLLTRGLLTPVGLRDTRKITLATGEALLRGLRNGDPQRRAALRFAVAGGALHEFGNPDGLDAADCAALLVPETAPDLLDRAPRLRSCLGSPCPRSLVHWCLARVVEEDRPLAAIALGLLAGCSPELGEQGPRVEAAWAALRERHPELPGRPIAFGDLRDLARRPSRPTRESEPIMTDVPAPAPALRDLGAMLDDLRERLPDAASAARRVAERLAADARPDDADLAAVTAAVGRFDEVRAQVADALPGPDVTELPALAAAVDAALDAERRRTRVRALRGLHGPEPLAGVLAEVRAAAAAGDGSAGLDALAELIEAMGLAELMLLRPELAAKARGLLPEAWRPLADYALAGLLSIVPGPRAPQDEPAARTGPEEPGDVPPAPKGEPDRPMPPFPDTDEADASSVSDGRSDDGAFSVSGGGSDDTEPSAPDDLADLDALLAASVPALPDPPPQAQPVSRRQEPQASSQDEEQRPGPVEDEQRDARDGARHARAGRGQDEGAGRGQDDERDRDEGARRGSDEGAERGRGEAPPVPAAEIVQAEVAALRAGRFGLAGRLRTAAGRPAAEERARRCAALAGEMVAFAGPLSAEFVEAARELGAKALANDPAGGVLAWAAAIRAGLVHPTPESVRLLEELTVVVSQHPDLKECGEAFARAARSGAYLGPGLAGRIRGSAEAATVRRNAAGEAARLLEEAPHQKIRYQLATEVWKSLVQPDGPVGRLLAAAERDDPERVDAVLAGVTDLRAGDAIDRMIDECSGRITAGRKNKKIIARARAQLVKKVETALDTVAEWAGAVRDAGAGPSGDGRDWRLGPFGQLQETVGGRGAALDAAFGALAAASDPVLAAAAHGARGLLRAALRLLGGEPLTGPEPPAAHVLNRHLLLATGLPLHPSTLEPLTAPRAADLVPVALAAEEEWTAAFEARARRDDHEGTRGIVAVLERRDPAAAARLRERRGELVARARKERDARVEELRDRIAVWVRDGVLDDERARDEEERLRALAGDRSDFDRVEERLDELRERLRTARREAIEGERARVAEWLAGRPRVDAADLDRIEGRLNAGDLTTAREFKAQLETGNPLPAAADDDGHLGRFHPAFPEVFAGIGDRAGNRVRRQEPSAALTGLKDALQRCSDVTDVDLAALLAGAGIKIPVLRNARREEAREGLRQWQAIGLGGKTDATIRGGVPAILKMIGLEGEPQDGPKQQHRTWIELEGVRRVGETPLPAFGSRMSPSGDRLRLVLVWRSPAPQQLIELLKGQPEDQTILVFYFGVLSADERRQLAVAARRRPAPVTAVLDDAAIGYLACMPEADWSAAVELTAPFTATNPYAPVGDVPDEMFYGRGRQLGQVTGRARCSFVYGGRQLGKSALLRKAQRDIERTDPSRKVILENIQTVGKAAHADSLWPKLADRLARAGVVPAGVAQRDEVCDAVRDWARDDPGRQVLVLLDEADHFLNEDAVDARFENVTALRDLMDDTGDRFKVVFAGLHQTARFESLPNQPLAHLGTPVAVGPLDAQNAFDLLVRPLAALGFRFDPTLAARVIAEANNAPALVQLFAEELLARLRRNLATVRDLPYEITRDDVEAVWRDKSLVRGFRDRFEWTLNLDKRYKVIAYTVALHALVVGTDETLSVAELWEQCERAWPQGFADCTSDGFRGLLDECVNLGVLGLSADRYRLRTPHILNLLGGIDDVQKALDNAGEFELPDNFDAHSYRGAYLNGPERAPLTSAQLARITRPYGLVHVVAGSRALHGDRVYLTLKAEETQRTDLKVHRVVRGGLTFEGARGRAGRHDGHTVIVVDVPDGQSADRFHRGLDEARAAVAATARGTLAVVLVAGPSLAPAWTRATEADGVELAGLCRFDPPAVRQWMSEDSQQGFPDDAGQEALLTTTGGWPSLIGQVVHRLADHGGDRDEALRHCAGQLRRAPAEFVRSTGVLADPSLAAAWRVLAAEDAPDTAADLALLLDIHGEESVPALAPAALRGRGYTGTADLVEALRVLGALAPAGGGRLACEPVLAEATRLMEPRR